MNLKLIYDLIKNESSFFDNSNKTRNLVLKALEPLKVNI
jgi:hypothetical protein